MSAGTATLIRGGRSGQIDESGINYEATFQVITTDKQDGPAIVALASGIPRYGDVYSVGNEIDFGIRAKSIVPSQNDKSPFVWEVRVVYSSNLGEDPERINQPDPTQRPAIVRWLHQEDQEPMITDINGTLVATPNGEALDPQPERLIYRPVLHIERNYLFFNDTVQFDYLGSINSDNFVSGAPRTWKCRQLQVDPEFENGFAYKRVIAEFVYKYDLWTRVALNSGFKFRPEGSTALIEIAGKKTKVFLNSSGFRSTEGPQLLTFYESREISFNALGLI